MKSHSIIISGRGASALKMVSGIPWREIARGNQMSAQLVAAIKLDRQHGTLASAIRLFVLGFYLKHRAQKTLASSHG
jgi:predicted DNA-binding ribbon-helix-helix protein